MLPVTGLIFLQWCHSFERLFCDILKAQSTVRLLLHADWMMLTNSSNQGEANSMTIAPLAHEIPAADAGRFESYISRKLFGG